jgi:hypothetical protein
LGPNFLVTESVSGQAGNKPSGLLGMMLAAMQRDQVQPNSDSMSASNAAPEYRPEGGLKRPQWSFPPPIFGPRR